MSRNFLQETLDNLHQHQKTIADIEWIGTHSYQIPIDCFFTLADFEYDAGFGAPQVATNLIIVGDDWWLERAEYDGSEWWAFKQFPKMPLNYFIPKKLVDEDGGWETLEEINETDG